MYDRTQTWIDERGIFLAYHASAGTYEDAVICLAAVYRIAASFDPICSAIPSASSPGLSFAPSP
jgi:hypothetical protein